MDCFNKSIELDPGYAAAYYNKCLLCAEAGDNANAILALKKAVELDPQYKQMALQSTQLNVLRNTPEFFAIIGQ